MAAKKQELIIFHYHLLPGGVTDVIKHSLSPILGLARIGRVTIVCGREENTERLRETIRELVEKEESISVELVILPVIDYMNLQKKDLDPQQLKNLLIDRFASRDSVWLIHNYHLGKNWAFTAALNQIAREEEQKMIYQIHDFPECARYKNLNVLKANIQGSLYPVSKTLRYCVINMRDYKIMKEAGIPDDSLFLLENPLPLENNPAAETVDKRTLMGKLKSLKPETSVFHQEGSLWLYPVRSIRRKNVLEGGLVTAMTEDPVNLIVTLPGISPQEKGYSDLCEKAFAKGLISGFWGTGTLPDSAGISYKELISASDLIYSSSVQEGFGYMYLNALLWKKPLLARYLDIMDGFLPIMENYPAHLYRSVLIPAGRSLKNELEKEYLQKYRSLETHLPESVKKTLKEDLYSIFSNDFLDFSYLSHEMQYNFLLKLKSPVLLSECRDLNHDLMEEIKKLNQPFPPDRKAQLNSGYGKRAYSEAFSNILNSFDRPSAEKIPDENHVDDNLLLRFTKSEFFRLLYN